MKIVFFGSGNMASAVFIGLVESKTIQGKDIFITNRSNEEELKRFNQLYQINYSYDDEALLKDADFVFLAVKPYDFDSVAERIKPYHFKENHFVSMMAGIPIDQIKNKLNTQNPVARIMPNTNAHVQQSVTGISYSDNFEAEAKSNLNALLEAFGTSIEVKEESLHDVTAITGSGPAFLYYVYEEYIKAAKRLGLSPDDTDIAVRNLIIGTGRMLENSELSIDQLRENITSKGGTTKAGLDALRKHPIEEMFIDCLEHALKRSKELSE
ncbi:pyrroline-5-carboxylate reductase [Macrococcoides canis]|uniref:pyrroline-5-carboxylate reductase n=1 Tax=Macrococcoides canis TaxID=1855823 RepID=UPI00165E8972|nr:pyrroline-5-carboxylate reductase [Macrococcus canis]MCO4095513.1 pyrroline-5-carboxylate reductase [Macrococcus canis]QNR08037.1 pyrroline-5-carboxylate reductase [Macrococcus canis]UTH08233.1 pyrroline-5-carboxylate reductase [Macrococcus canis]